MQSYFIFILIMILEWNFWHVVSYPLYKHKHISHCIILFVNGFRASCILFPLVCNACYMKHTHFPLLEKTTTKTLCIPHPCSVFNYRLNCPVAFIKLFGAFSISCCQIITVATPLTKWAGKILDYKLRVAYVIGHGFRVLMLILSV